MEGFNHLTSGLWAHPLHFLHHKNDGGVDVVTSHKKQVNLDSYIGELDLFDWHHGKQRREPLVQTQDIQSVLKWVPHPSYPIHPAMYIKALDLQERISEMKEAKAAQQILAMKVAKVVQQRLNQAESRIYEAAVAI